MKGFKLWRTLAVAVLAAHAGTAAADVVPIDQSVAGQSQRSWTATWWQTMMLIPTAQNPIGDTNGSLASGGDLGSVFMLAGTTGGTANRTITVRSDQYLLIPLINILYLNSDGITTEADMRGYADEDVAFFIGLFANLNNVPLVPDLLTQRIDSPAGLFNTTFNADNIFGNDAGTFESVAAGYWLMLEPLPLGTSTLHFGGSSVGSPFVPDFSTDVTYTINVVPAPGAAALMGLRLGGLMAARRRR